MPILVRPIEKQEKYFSAGQKDVYERVKSRQYQTAIATEFMKLSEAERTAFIDKIADDIEGMIERRRVLSAGVDTANQPVVRARRAKELDPKAQDYEKVDFVTDGEVVLNRPTNHAQRDVLAHVGFIERLYVQGKRGRVEFGVRRAFVSISNHGTGSISRIDELKAGGDRKTYYYTILHGAPNAVTVCMDPPAVKSSLAELPLPPAKDENYLSRIAIASADVNAGEIEAELGVSLNAEGLYLVDGYDLSPRTEAAIKAIMDVAKAKVVATNNQTLDATGQFRRTLPVRERP
ncbi:MAG: hypothetical protein WB760_14350 [Xanthobacteraceae bacterium]